MKFRFSVIVAIILLFSCGPVLAAQATKKVVENNFAVTGCSPELGTASSVALQGVLSTYADSGYEIEKREVLNDLLAGSGLGLTSLISKKKAHKLDADFMIDGSLSLESGLYQLDVFLIDMPTQKMLRKHSVSASSVSEMMEKLPEIALIVLDISLAINEEPPARLLPADNLSYNSWYTDGNGVHKGGKIILQVDGEKITGTSVESYGQAKMSGRIQGNLLIGIYEASYGYGNFEFEIIEQGKVLKGSYYQVSNGAKGEWSGRLE